MSDHLFGGAWTEWKLDAVERYLQAYLQITDGHRLTRWYVDAFAGSGTRSDPAQGDAATESFLDEEIKRTRIYEGSAHRALDYAFERFLLIEYDAGRAAQLDAIARQHGKDRQTTIIQGDGIANLERWCGSLSSHDRAVVFLDPYDMSVPWKTMEILAATGKADVFILYPAMAINRNLPRNRIAISDAHRIRLDQCFGCTDWVRSFYEEHGVQESFLGPGSDVIQRTANIPVQVSFYLDRLATIFRGGVSREVRWLTSNQGSPLFALMFAMANPDKRAHGPGLRVANHILKQSRH